MNTPQEINQWRKARRIELMARLQAVTKVQQRQWNSAITKYLLKGFPILQWLTVSFYMPLEGEYDPRYAIRRLKKGGASVVLPVVSIRKGPLEFRAWWPGVAMTDDLYGFPVPNGTSVLLPQAMLIPPFGFDAQGYRLGYGSGYFTRTINSMKPRPLRIGVAFEISRIATIHPQCSDVPMDFIVTDAGIHHVSGSGLERVHDACDAGPLSAKIILERNRATCHGKEQSANNLRMMNWK